ncbi:MAG: glycosyltransferase family 9 protein [Myxococcales bacterium]|nr:glycosyltransferase family 9 protein [Myxococcales bacterium]
MIIRLGAMGDVVRTLPALQALRVAYPDAHISWLVEKRAAGVLEGRDDLDRVIQFPREHLMDLLRRRQFDELWRQLTGFVRALRAGQFDLVIDFHAILKSGVLAMLSGARTRVSYSWPFSREWSFLFANHRARLSPHKMSRYDRNAGLLKFLAIDSVETAILTVDKAADTRMGLALNGSKAWILIHPGSSSGADYKRYRPSGYADLARGLKRRTGLDSIVAQGTSAEERALAEEIVAGSRGAARLAPATSDLAELIALIDRARLFVGSDSGPLHLATSLGTPAVQIMGPTDPIENEPRRGTHWKRVRLPVPCSPCRRGCAQATCMAIIPHDLVLEAALECLADSRNSSAAKRMALSRTPAVSIAQPWA